MGRRVLHLLFWCAVCEFNSWRLGWNMKQVNGIMFLYLSDSCAVLPPISCHKCRHYSHVACIMFSNISQINGDFENDLECRDSYKCAGFCLMNIWIWIVFESNSETFIRALLDSNFGQDTVYTDWDTLWFPSTQMYGRYLNYAATSYFQILCSSSVIIPFDVV
jgi:hypothetical protein